MKNTRLTIEDLKAADIDLLKPLAKEFVQTHQSLAFKEDPWSAFQDWLSRGLDNADAACLIARINGDIVGFIAGDVRQMEACGFAPRSVPVRRAACAKVRKHSE